MKFRGPSQAFLRMAGRVEASPPAPVSPPELASAFGAWPAGVSRQVRGTAPGRALRPPARCARLSQRALPARAPEPPRAATLNLRARMRPRPALTAIKSHLAGSHILGTRGSSTARKRFTWAVGNDLDGKAGLRKSKAAVIRGI